NGQKIPGRNAEFIATNPERDDCGGSAILSGTNDLHGRVRPELADRIEDPAQGEAARFEFFGSANDRREIRFRFLTTQKHHSDRESHLSVDDAVPKELFAQIVRNQSIVRGIAEVTGNPFKGVEKTEKVRVVVAAAYLVLAGGNAVSGSQFADSRRLNCAFEMKVKLGLGKVLQEGFRIGFTEHRNSL